MHGGQSRTDLCRNDLGAHSPSHAGGKQARSACFFVFFEFSVERPKPNPQVRANGAQVVMQAEDLKVWFPITAGLLKRTVDHVKAVDGVSLAIRAGRTVGVVGESGSGKTTLGLALLRLVKSTGGDVTFLGQDLLALGKGEVRDLRSAMQIVFQDPFGSLSPRMSIGQIIAEKILEERLAACVNLQATSQSLYWWKGKITQDQEHTLLIKTKKEAYPKLEGKIQEIHPFDVPEIIALPILIGSEDYLDWIENETRA